MISLYSGTPGSGKSLHTASVIYWRLRMGKPVIANFEINLDAIKKRKGEYTYVPNDKLCPQMLILYSRQYFKNHRFHEGAIVLFIDECQLLFNSREWDKPDRKQWLSFFTQHRKYGFDIVLVAQFDRMLDRQIRSLIEYNHVHRKVGNFGFWGKLFSAVTMGKLFVAVKMWYPLNEKVGADWFKAKKRYYSLYDSYKHFDEVEEAPKQPKRIRRPAAAGEGIEQNKEIQSPQESSEILETQSA